MKCVAILLFAAGLCCAQVRRLLPSDDSGRDASLATFVAKLKDTVAREDVAVLESMLSPGIRTSFGGDGGIADFRSMWKLDQSGSAVWPLLRRLLAMGGTLKQGSYSVPHVFGRFPDDLDAFDYAAITGRGVWLRAGPSTSDRGIRKMDYEIVRVRAQGEEWWTIETLSGQRGYVSAQYIHSPVGWRAIFSKEKGEWKMTALVEGD